MTSCTFKSRSSSRSLTSPRACFSVSSSRLFSSCSHNQPEVLYNYAVYLRANLHLFVFLCQFATQLLELVFQRVGLAVLGLCFIGLLLQQVCSFLVLGVISFQFFHIRQQLRVLPLNSFDLIEWFEIVE